MDRASTNPGMACMERGVVTPAPNFIPSTPVSVKEKKKTDKKYEVHLKHAHHLVTIPMSNL
jgi:hypothetical protein